MFRKSYYLIPVALAACLIQNASAQTYTWTAGGDGTTWSQAANWSASGVPTSGYQIWMDPQLSTVQTITLGASDVAYASDNVFLEWGQTLNIAGSLSSGFFFTPVGGIGGPTTTINLYGNGSLSSADSIFVGDPPWFAGIPNVAINLYDNSQMTTTWLGLAGHLNIYGGTVTTANLLTGTPTTGPWGGATTDATRLINIAGGRLLVAGDITAQVNDLIARGILEGNGVVGNVNVDLLSNPGYTVLTAVPEPTSVALLGLGGAVMMLVFRRRR
jgi:hypothetical protein